MCVIKVDNEVVFVDASSIPKNHLNAVDMNNSVYDFGAH